jgi:hypothetical protein
MIEAKIYTLDRPMCYYANFENQRQLFLAFNNCQFVRAEDSTGSNKYLIPIHNIKKVDVLIHE